MPRLDILRSSPIERSFRVEQLLGMFDIPPTEKSEQRWSLNFELPAEWNIGVIVGPSGSGKSTIARELFRDNLVSNFDWPKGACILDAFPKEMSIKDVVLLLSSVGFSSPPSWLRPFAVLSTGEQFRATMARALAEQKSLVVMDEFTSVIDRTVAKIGSSAIAKTVRRRKQQFIAVTCHYDVIEWLEPDWVFQPHLNNLELTRGLLRRPQIEIVVKRVHSSAWSLFKHHHYLTAEINSSAFCFCAFIENRPVAFDAWLPFCGHLPFGQKARRGHRTVCLPDFQGVGIGNALFTHIASAWKALGFRAFSCTGHPAEIVKRMRSPDWKCTHAPRHTSPDNNRRRARARATGRLVASFEFIGQPMQFDVAKKLIEG